MCKFALEILTILYYEIWGYVARYVQLLNCYILYKIYSSYHYVTVLIIPNKIFALKSVLLY